MIIGDGIMLGAGGESASIFVTGLSETNTVTATNGSKTKIGKWTQKPNPVSHGLPDGYTELEYIESSGTQYIDTEFKPKGTTKIICDFQMVNQGTEQQGVFGSRPGASGRFTVFTGNGTSALQIDYDTSETLAISGNSISGLNLNNRNTIEVSNSLIINGNTIKTVSAVSFTSTYNLFLFANNNVGTAQLLGTLKLYSCQIYDNGLLVRDFIPCKKADGTVGMLDNINSVFYGNAGTGVFTAGPEIPQNFYGFLIDKIKDYGTWTVTATNGTKTATQDVLVDSATQYGIELNYKLYLYRDGDECEDVTGGWTNSGYTYNGSANGAVTKYSDSMYATTHIGDSLTAGIVNPVDVTNYSTLFAEVMRTDSSNLFQPWIGIASDKSLSDKLITPNASAANVKETLSIDITSLTGNKYIAFVHSNGMDSGSGYVYKIWLE